MQQFKVGDKVQTTEGWGHYYSHAIVTDSKPNSYGKITATWFYPNGVTIRGHEIRPELLYLLKPQKKGLCMFLDKVQQEYSK